MSCMSLQCCRKDCATRTFFEIQQLFLSPARWMEKKKWLGTDAIEILSLCFRERLQWQNLVTDISQARVLPSSLSTRHREIC